MKLNVFCESVLYTWKFNLLDHVVEDLVRFGNVETLDASQFERGNLPRQTCIHMLISVMAVWDAGNGWGER